VPPPLAVKVELAPVQIEFVPEIDADTVFTVKALFAVAVHPLELVAVTEYVPAVETVIDVVIAPVLQEYEVPPLAVKDELAPAQIVLVPLIEVVGEALTVSVLLAVAVQPLEVTVTV